ncbi:MAG: hypothetical protein R3C01_10430 [Planctomycetaceae bacterium]
MSSLAKRVRAIGLAEFVSLGKNRYLPGESGSGHIEAATLYLSFIRHCEGSTMTNAPLVTD